MKKRRDEMMKKRWGFLLALFLLCTLLMAGCNSQPELHKTEEMVHIVYSAAEGEAPLTTEELKSCWRIMGCRMSAMGMTGYSVNVNDKDSTVELFVPRRYYPGNLNKIAYEWCSKGEVFICAKETNDNIAPNPSEDTVLDNHHVTFAEATYMEGKYVVMLNFTEEGAQVLADVTEELTAVKGYLAIWMDHQIVLSAQVSAPITNGEAIVTGFTSWESASLFAAKINAGVLPRDLHASVDFSGVQE